MTRPARPGLPAGLRARWSAVEDTALSRWRAVLAWIQAHPRLALWYALGLRIIARQSAYRLSLSAAGVAFWLVIALFPAVVAVVLMFGVVVDPAQLAADVARIGDRAPDTLAAVLAQQAQTVAAADARTVSTGLLVSLIVVLWSVSSGGYALFRAIRQAYGLPPQNYVVARFRSMLAAILGVVLLGVLIVGSTVVGPWVASLESGHRLAALALGAVAVAALLVPLLLGVVRFSVARPTRLRVILPGVALASVVIAAMLFGVSVFGVFAREYQAMYGVVASIVLAMVVAYAAMYALLLCVLFDVERHALVADRSAA